MRRRQFIADPRVLCALVLVATLVPAQVGLSTLRPVPVLHARGDAPIPDPSVSESVPDPSVGEVESGTASHRDDDPADSIAMLAAALEDCPNALPPALRLRIARVIHEESEEYGYDPLFITALMQVESGCSVTARGGAALGLVQLLPSTARGVALRAGLPWRGERSLTEPSMSIQLGLRYLDELEDQLGDTYRAVAAYNLGPARVAHMSSGRAQRTQYVRKILNRYEQLLDQYA